jgi:cellulose synthase/poly-beta-1,6-N-acetylglucosamine synthase-like glycosyltransferase
MTLMLVGIALLVAWPLYSVVLIWLAMRSERVNVDLRRLDAMAPTRDEPQVFWIVVPCLNEERVVERTVRAALTLAGPPGSSTYVLVVDDASDDSTPDVLASITHPNLVVLRRELPDARRGKGEALNAAYKFILKCSDMYGQDRRQVAVGVIDGDGRGSVNLLTEVARALRDPKVGAVQARVRIHNRDRVLGAVQDLEFACVANASQVLRDGLGTVGLGGNGQFTRLSALVRLGSAPWSSCLVEDLELGIRMHLGGEKIRYLSLASVAQQGVVDVRRLLRQRTRWAQGNLQCVRYLPRLIASRRIGNLALTEMSYYLLAPWLNAVGSLAIIGLFCGAAWRLLTGHGAPFVVTSWRELLVMTGIGALAMWLPHLLWAVLHRWQLRDERFTRMFLAGLVYPMFLFLGLLGTWRAVGRQATGRNSWTKTERLAESPATTR